MPRKAKAMKSGARGVAWDKSENKWRVRLGEGRVSRAKRQTTRAQQVCCVQALGKVSDKIAVALPRG